MYARYTHTHTHTPKHIQESPKERKKKINNNKAVLRHNHKRPIDPKRADPFVAPPHPTDRQPLHIELHTNNRWGQQSCCSGFFSRYRYEVVWVTGVCSVSFISSLVQFSGCRLLAAVRASLTSRPTNKRWATFSCVRFWSSSPLLEQAKRYSKLLLSFPVALELPHGVSVMSPAAALSSPV